jgi:hypothetical protein
MGRISAASNKELKGRSLAIGVSRLDLTVAGRMPVRKIELEVSGVTVPDMGMVPACSAGSGEQS